MKKYLKYIVICFLMFFCFNSDVNAEMMRVCRYQSSSLLGTQYYDSIFITASGITGYRSTKNDLLPSDLLNDVVDYDSTELNLKFTASEFMPNWNDDSASCPSEVYGDAVDMDFGFIEFGQNIYLTSGFGRISQEKTSDNYDDFDNIVVPDPDDKQEVLDPPGGGGSVFTGSCPSDSSIISLFGSFYSILKIAVPIALVIFGTLDFAKAVVSSDEGKMKKAQSAFVRRVMAAVVVLLVMSLVSLLSKLIPSESGIFSCVKQILK